LLHAGEVETDVILLVVAIAAGRILGSSNATTELSLQELGAEQVFVFTFVLTFVLDGC
jgi:hypothetical protein